MHCGTKADVIPHTSDSGSDSSVSDGPPLHVAAPKKVMFKLECVCVGGFPLLLWSLYLHLYVCYNSLQKKRKKLKSRKERNKHKALLKMTQKLAPIAVPQVTASHLAKGRFRMCTVQTQGPVDQVMLPSLGHKVVWCVLSYCMSF